MIKSPDRKAVIPEITPAMIEAGVAVLMTFFADESTPRDHVESVFMQALASMREASQVAT